METVYLIVKEDCEDCEDGYETNYGFLKSRIEAENVVVYYNKRVEWFKELNEQAYAERERIEKQLGILKYEPTFEIPKWKSGIAMDKITTTMRNERDRLNAANDATFKRNNKKYKAWCDQSDKSMAVWWEQHLTLDNLDNIEKDLLDDFKPCDGMICFKYLDNIKFYVKSLCQFNHQNIII